MSAWILNLLDPQPTPITVYRHSPAQVVAALLEGEGLFSTPGAGDWPLYISSMPDEGVGSVGAIYDTAGIKRGRTMQGKEYRAHGFQIKVRTQVSIDAVGKVETVAERLSQFHNQTVVLDGTTYVIDSITQPAGVLRLGEDSKRRSLYSLNGLLMLR